MSSFFTVEIILIMLFKREKELSEYYSDDEAKAKDNGRPKMVSSYF